MDVNSLKIARVFSSGGDIHYVLPLFQREYTWERSNWDTLLSDLYGIYNEYVGEKVPEHFMGSLVVVEDGHRNGLIPAFRLVDGQQRLTTISLVLHALGRIVQDSHPSLVTRIKKMLLNADESGDVRYKLFPTTKYGDRDIYTALLDDRELPAGDSKIREAFDYLNKELGRKIAGGEIDPERFFVIVTTSLQVVLISLNSNESPYQIFESLNAKGKPLSQADLVRNYIAMKVTALDQEALYHQHWAKIEDLLQEQRLVGRSGLGELTAFLRHYLAMRSGALANQSHVYARFRDRIETEFKEPTRIVEELSTLHRFAGYYAKLLRPESEPDSAIRDALQRLNVMDAATAYPFLLSAFDAREESVISSEELLQALTTLENYLVRRYLAGENTNYLTRMFPLLWRTVNQDDFLPSLKAALATRNYPTDGRIRQELLTRKFYDNKSGSRDKLILVLDSINRHQARFEDVNQSLRGAATIEHVLPQTPPEDWKEKWKVELGADWQQFYDDYLQWKADLGDDWASTYQEYLHTLGNLTLVTQEWQFKLSNKPFAIKEGLLAGQGLHLNKYFDRDIVRWDENAIRQRADALATAILELWPVFAVPIVVMSPNGESSGSDASTPKRSWDEASMLADLAARRGPDEVAIAKEILDWAKVRATRIWWSDNSTQGSFVPIYNHQGRDHQLFVTRAGGEVEIYFYWYQYKPPFDSEEKRRELLQRLNALTGVSLPMDAITKRPCFPLAILQSESSLRHFLETFEWFIAEVSTSPSAETFDLTASSTNAGTTAVTTKTPLQQLQLDYWTEFSRHLAQSGSFLKPRTPLPQKWMSFTIGRSGFDTAVEINTWDKSIYVSLNLLGPDRLHYFHLLHVDKTVIEAEFPLSPEVQLHWGEMRDKKISRIQLIRSNADPADRTQWEEQHRWLLENLEVLHRVFSPRIKALGMLNAV